MPKIIGVIGQKGGSGKSTIAINLAINIAESAKIAVLDLDPQGSLIQLKELVTNFDIIPYKGEINTISQLDFDIILVDTSPYLSDYLPKLIKIADLIITPIKASVLDLLSFKNTLDLIEQENKIEQTLVVFNMIKPNTTLTKNILINLEEYNVPIAKTHISDLVAFTRSVLVGGVRSDKNAQRQLDNLTKEVLTKLI